MIIEIKYGPFESQYHRDLVNEEFKHHVKTFVDSVLSPQLGEHPRLIKGTVEARFNEEKHCGPNGAIRNDFRFSLKFTSKSGESDYEAELKYVNPSFEARRGSSFYLWTPKRKQKREEQVHKIEMVIIKVEEGKKVDERCPVCGRNSYVEMVKTC